jgi:hypothetical protein
MVERDPTLLILGDRRSGHDRREAPRPTGERRRGRPVGWRTPTPKSSLSTSVPIPVHDRLIDMANDRGVSVSALVRAMLLSYMRRAS